MNRGLVRMVTIGIALAAAIAGLIYGGLTAYCFADVSNFYADAVELRGTIADVKSFPGGPAPAVTFVDPSGKNQEVQFGPFYKTSPDAIGEPRTVLYNPGHRPYQALASPWNWIGSIVYGSLTLCLGAIAGIFFYLTPGVVPSDRALGNGE